MFVAAVAATAAVATVAILIMRGSGEASERAFPAYWSDLREGQTTEAQLRARLGPPDELESRSRGFPGRCLVYDNLVVSEVYKFCFSSGVLFHKAAQ